MVKYDSYLKKTKKHYIVKSWQLILSNSTTAILVNISELII